MEMSRDMAMGSNPDWQGNVAALRVAQLIVSEIWTGQQTRAGLADRIKEGMAWVAQIGFPQVYDLAVAQAMCEFVNEKIGELQAMSKEDRAKRFPQAPKDIDAWPMISVASRRKPRRKPAKSMPDYAGLRQYRKARSTGIHVGVYDGVEAGLDTDGGRWQTICEEHGHICSHDTLALARAHAACPEGWCEVCQRIVSGWPCLNVSHNEVDCATAGLPRDQWCPPCQGRR